MLLMALNEAFGRQSIDILLTIARLDRQRIRNISGDGVPTYAPLIAANLITIEFHPDADKYTMRLSNKGNLFVEAWKRGDQRAAIELPVSGGTAETKGPSHAT
jgi:hypothetical protein